MMTVSPLSPALGAEIGGVDLSHPLSETDVAAIRRAWLDGLIVLFRDQSIDADAQSRFCRHFGELELVKSVPSQIAEQPHVLFVTNVRDGGLRTVLEDGEMNFHSDQCYYEVPCKATTLFAIEIPPVGGNTLFANCYAAYETLPAAVKARLEGRRGLNVYDYGASPTLRGKTFNPDAPHWSHPVVRTHPETGRKALFVNRLMTHAIEGLEAAESDELLAFLFDHQERPEFVYEHFWRPGDLMMWDNRCTLHARSDFDPGHRRMLRRITIRGDGPIG